MVLKDWLNGSGKSNFGEIEIVHILGRITVDLLEILTSFLLTVIRTYGPLYKIMVIFNPVFNSVWSIILRDFTQE